jgi:hypothetical protein
MRKLEGKKERWQDKPCEYRQGCKHKSTGKFMRAAKQWVMQECMVRGYNQVNLLARSGANNYWVEKRGKENNPDFKTNKDMIRERLDDLIEKADEPTREKFITDKKEYQKRSDAKAEAILKDMYAEEYSGKDPKQSCISVLKSIKARTVMNLSTYGFLIFSAISGTFISEILSAVFRLCACSWHCNTSSCSPPRCLAKMVSACAYIRLASG